MGEGLVSNDDAIKLDDPRDRGEHVCILLIAQVVSQEVCLSSQLLGLRSSPPLEGESSWSSENLSMWCRHLIISGFHSSSVEMLPTSNESTR